MSGSPALLAAFAAVDAAIPADSVDTQLLIAAKCRGLMTGYDARWRDQEWVALQLEQTVVLPIVNPDTGRTSRTWRHAGKHDGIIAGYGKTSLLEHKSTSDEIGDPSSPYWRRLAIDGQVSQYVLQAWQSGVRLDSTLYDVIRKPQIRPKQIAAKERQQVVVSGLYHDQPVTESSVDRLRGGATDEDLTLYELRLAAETLADPTRYYQRRTVPRIDNDIAEYAEELWTIGKEIQRAQLRGLHFRNPDSCVTYGSPCEYLGICSGVEMVEHNDKWERVSRIHQELEGIDIGAIAGGGDVLTHSRIKCFQACRRKHYLRYVEGLRRRNDDDREALYFGKVLHLALEAWWREKSTAATVPQEGEANAAIGNGYPVSAAG